MPFTSATLSTSFLPTPRVLWTLVALCVLGWLARLGLAQDSLPVLPIQAWQSDDAGIQDAMTTLSLPQVSVAPGAQVTIPLTLALRPGSGQALTQGQVYGVDVVVTYDPAVATAVRVERGALAAEWSLASNLETPGVARVGLAGATPIETGGELLLFVFDAVGQAGSGTDLTLTRGELNEGDIPTTLQHGHLNIELPTSTPTATYTPTPTTTSTPTPTATHTPTVTNTPTPTDTPTPTATHTPTPTNTPTPTDTPTPTPTHTPTVTPTPTDTPTITPTPTDTSTVEMPLQLGWNHISLPLEPVTSYTAESVCDEIISQGGDVVEIDRWYASGWDGHICGLPFNDFAIELGSD